MVPVLLHLVDCHMDPLVVISHLNKLKLSQMRKHLMLFKDRITCAKHLVLGQVSMFIIDLISILKSCGSIRGSQREFGS